MLTISLVLLSVASLTAAVIESAAQDLNDEHI
ncbi:hypothetical protein CTP10_R45120 [Cupriavidus sp. P-10]|nr:hypothetical protein CTP10_R45120 [Cupriavidus sp. P-10]